MTTWILVIYLASGAAIEQRTPYADAATCARNARGDSPASRVKARVKYAGSA